MELEKGMGFQRIVMWGTQHSPYYYTNFISHKTRAYFSPHTHHVAAASTLYTLHTFICKMKNKFTGKVRIPTSQLPPSTHHHSPQTPWGIN